jgi:hypothetical protein
VLLTADINIGPPDTPQRSSSLDAWMWVVTRKWRSNSTSRSVYVTSALHYRDLYGHTHIYLYLHKRTLRIDPTLTYLTTLGHDEAVADVDPVPRGQRTEKIAAAARECGGTCLI